MTIWTANEAHLALFNEIADDYKADAPRRHRDHVRPAAVRELHDHADHPDRRRQRAPTWPGSWRTRHRDFVTSGALVPLDDTLRGRTATSSPTSAQRATKLWQTDGKLYAYPFSTSPFGVFVNTDLIKAAGQQTPAELIAAGEWTWDNAIAVNAAVNAETGKAGPGRPRLRLQGLGQPRLGLERLGRPGRGARTARPAAFDQQPMVDAMTVPAQGDLHRQGAPGPGHRRRLLRRRRAMTITQISPGLAAQGREVRLGPGAAARRPERRVRA